MIDAAAYLEGDAAPLRNLIVTGLRADAMLATCIAVACQSIELTADLRPPTSAFGQHSGRMRERTEPHARITEQWIGPIECMLGTVAHHPPCPAPPLGGH